MSNQDVHQRTRTLRRRILVSTVAVIGGLWLIWDSWGLPADDYLRVIGGTVLFVLVLAIPGALAGMLLGWYRRRR